MFQYCVCIAIVLTVILVLALGWVGNIIFYHYFIIRYWYMKDGRNVWTYAETKLFLEIWSQDGLYYPKTA